MENIRSIPVPTTIRQLLNSRKPTRIAVLLRSKSPLYLHSRDEVVEAACFTLDIPIHDGHPTLLVIEKWDKLDVLAFDIFHAAYDPSTAHHVADLPVVLIDYGKRYSVVKTASPNFEKEVNVAVAREHNLNGWDARPPFVADHTAARVPTYPNPRNMVTWQRDPAVQLS